MKSSVKLSAIVLLLASPLWADFDRTHPAPMDEPHVFAAPTVDKSTLSNAAELAVAETRRLPLVSVEILLPFAGSALDPKGQHGLATLVASMLDEGTTTRSGDQISDELDALGSRIAVAIEKATGEVEKDYLRISIFVTKRDGEDATLAQKLDKTLDIASDMIQNPAFPQAALDRVKRDTLAGIRQAKGNPEKLADRRLAEATFGDDPYGRSPDEAAIANATREQLLDYHAKRFVPSGAVISVNGAVSAEEMRALAEKHFGAWTAPAGAPNEVALPRLAERPPSEHRSGLTIELVDMPGLRQSSIRLGHLSVSRDDPDYFSVVVMNTVLGRNTITSRLGHNLREVHHWTYGANSSVSTYKRGGAFAVSTEVQTDKTADALREILKELHRMQEEPVPAEELQDQKMFAAGVFTLQHEDAQSMAAEIGADELLGAGPDVLSTYKNRILAVTAEQVQVAARKYLHPDAINIVIVGDGNQVYGELASIAPVRVVDRDGRPRQLGVEPRG